jgi:hypothetical protein
MTPRLAFTPTDEAAISRREQRRPTLSSASGLRICEASRPTCAGIVVFSKYVNKTLELGRLPSDEEMDEGSCGNDDA